LNTKMTLRWMGPMVVVRRTKGGSYLCCEMDGSMFHGKIGQFRVIPFEQRTSIDLPEKILDLIDLSKEKLEELAEEGADEDEYLGKDMQFHRISIRPKKDGDEESESDSESYMSDVIPDLEDESEDEPDPDAPPVLRRSKRVQDKGVKA
jgi:hypothetical protein